MSQIWSKNTTYAITPSDSCTKPCYSGEVKLETPCCHVLVKGCLAECEVVHEKFLRHTPEELTLAFSKAGSASLEVETVDVKTTPYTFVNSIFSDTGRITLLACFGAAVIICCLYALTHA